MNDPADALTATAADWLRARGAHEAAAILARTRVAVLDDPTRWTVEGRSVQPTRVAVWLTAVDRVRVDDAAELRQLLQEAFASAVESPTALLRELLILQAPSTVPSAFPVAETDPYRTIPPTEPNAAAVAQGAAELLEAWGAANLGGALRRAAVALQPVGNRGTLRVFVALDAADLAEVQREPHSVARVKDAVAIAGLTPTRRIGEVLVGLRRPTGVAPLEPGAAERLAAAAQAADWVVVPLQRSAASTSLVLVRGGQVLVAFVEDTASTWHAHREPIAAVRVPAHDLADDDSARRAVERIARA